MEWVEATGRTVTEAKDAALDLLGVAGDEAEFEVIAEAEKGLFGRVKTEARVRSRVRPTQPRPKVERDRGRGGRNKGRAKSGGDNKSGDRAANRDSGKSGGDAKKGRDANRGQRQPVAASGGNGGSGNGGSGNGGSGNGQAKTDSARTSDAGDAGGDSRRGQSAPRDAAPAGTGVSLAEQGTTVSDFMTGLVDAFGLTATVNTVTIDEETLEIQVEGSELGLLIGPKANTLRCVQELSRTVVQRQGDREQGRVRVDVGSYYAERRASLARFTTKVAEQVRETGEEVALEPMRAADRKVVHDTIGELDGVDTISEGSDPDRRVVITPAGN